MKQMGTFDLKRQACEIADTIEAYRDERRDHDLSHDVVIAPVAKTVAAVQPTCIAGAIDVGALPATNGEVAV